MARAAAIPEKSGVSVVKVEEEEEEDEGRLAEAAADSVCQTHDTSPAKRFRGCRVIRILRLKSASAAAGMVDRGLGGWLVGAGGLRAGLAGGRASDVHGKWMGTMRNARAAWLLC